MKKVLTTKFLILVTTLQLLYGTCLGHLRMFENFRNLSLKISKFKTKH